MSTLSLTFGPPIPGWPTGIGVIGFGPTIVSFRLTSDCVANKMGYAFGYAILNSISVGPFPVAANLAAEITMNDGLSTVNTGVFSGLAALGSAGIQVGQKGIGAGILHLGGAKGRLKPGFGVDLSFTAAVGFSRVYKEETRDCCAK